MTSTGARPTLCALHVHSTWSDGEFSLAELRQIFLRQRVGVVCLADHNYSFTPERVAAYLAESSALSDDQFAFIPGLEFECEDRMHIVGYGVVDLIDSTDPETVVRHIRSAGGVSVIAHPKDSHFDRIEALSVLPDGIEVWNSKYDGRYAPRARTFALLQRLQARGASVRAFYGQDLHWRTQFRELYTSMELADPGRGAVLECLTRGAFSGRKGELQLPSDGRLDQELLERFDVLNARSAGFYARLKRLKSLTGWLGRHLPARIKAQLRRIF